jgi:shikimate kinase
MIPQVRMMIKNNIVLIGFMAIGKGRTARELHRQTGRFSVDTDDLIESLVKMKIKKIFKKYGEAYFRELEKLTADWLRANVENSIVSTGGGFFKVADLSAIGTVVYLNSDFECLLKRVLDQPGSSRKIAKRPLLADKNAARSLYLERLPLYRQVCDIEIDVTEKSTRQVAEEIIEKTGIIPY